jgi:uncharacterized protein (DUF427 family)
MMQATWNGKVIAQSDVTVVVEGNHYFPIESVNRDILSPSSTTTVCHWKGTSNYYTLTDGDDESVDAVWFYETPKPEAAAIKDHVAFSRDVDVAEAP